MIASSINLQKLWYLLALSSHYPHHRHLEWLRLMRVQLWSICLTNHKLKVSCPMKYEYSNLMLLDLGPKQVLVIVRIHVSSRTPTGYLLSDDMEQAHIKMTRQTDNEHLGISFIYHWYSFLLWDALLNVHYGHAVNFHHEWCMAYISGPGISLTHIQTPWAHKFPTYFTSHVSINKRSWYQLNESKCNVESVPHDGMVELTYNLQA
jgi:hypothetical protein